MATRESLKPSKPPAAETDAGRAKGLASLQSEAAAPDALDIASVIEDAGEEQTQANWEIAPSLVDFEDPLITVLSLLSALLHRPVSTEALKAGLPLGERRFTPDLAVRAAERAGLGASVVRRAKLRQILPVTLPCILLLKGGNACILLDFEGKADVKVVLPEGGGTQKSLPVDALQEQYTGYAIYARPEFRFDERAPDIKVKEYRSWFWGTLWQFWPIYSHVLLASIVINCFAIASPLFIMNVYDRVVPNNAMETLWVLAIGVLTVFGFEFVMRNLRT